MASNKLVTTSTPGIYKRGSRYVVIYRDHKGHQRKKAARTLAEARSVKSSMKTDVDRGEFHAASKITFEEFGRKWLERYEGRTEDGIRPHTLAGYKATLEMDAFPAIGRMRLSEITLGDLKTYAADLGAGRRKGYAIRTMRDGKPIALNGKPLSRNSVRLALAPVKAMLADAHEEGVIRGNPASGLRIVVKKDKARTRDEKALTPEQVRALLDTLPEQWRLLFEFMAHTGLRIGEAIGLRWRNVALADGFVHVEERFYRGTWDDPKSEFGIRDVPITRTMAEALGELWQEARPESGEALVFPSANGTPLNTANLYNRVFKKAARAAGVPHATFHTLRHSAATMLREAGYSSDDIQLVLGHHSAAFTADVYIHRSSRHVPAPEFMDAVTRGEGGNKVATRATDTSRDSAHLQAVE